MGGLTAADLEVLAALRGTTLRRSNRTAVERGLLAAGTAARLAAAGVAVLEPTCRRGQLVTWVVLSARGRAVLDGLATVEVREDRSRAEWWAAGPATMAAEAGVRGLPVPAPGAPAAEWGHLAALLASGERRVVPAPTPAAPAGVAPVEPPAVELPTPVVPSATPGAPTPGVLAPRRLVPLPLVPGAVYGRSAPVPSMEVRRTVASEVPSAPVTSGAMYPPPAAPTAVAGVGLVVLAAPSPAPGVEVRLAWCADVVVLPPVSAPAPVVPYADAGPAPRVPCLAYVPPSVDWRTVPRWVYRERYLLLRPGHSRQLVARRAARRVL